jgi:tetratricopeptide (TPR) repeat protein
MASDPPSPAAGRRPATWWQRALLGVAGPVVVLGILEGALRLGGYGVSGDLFIPDTTPGMLRTNPDFTRPYFPARFDIGPLDFRIAARKAPGHFRVFILGESAARGVPEPGLGLAPLLRAELRSAYPGRVIDVFDLGIVAVNSHAVLETAREASRLEPDLFVVYAGNNEVVGPFGPGSANLAAMPPLPVIRAAVWIQRTRTGQLLGRLISGLRRPAAGELQWHGMSTFTDRTVGGDDPRLAAVYRNFAANLDAIVEIGRSCGVKVVLSTVVANLRDCAPFAPRHRTGLSAIASAQWQLCFDQGRRAWELGDLERAGPLLRRAAELDPQEADGRYLLGQVLDQQGDLRGAREELVAALHWDALRFRPDPAINAVVRAVARAHPGTALLADAAFVLRSDPDSDGRCAGRELLWEHVHLNWGGNKAVARLLASLAGGALFGAPTGPWLDDAGSTAAVGYTPFAVLRMLRALGPIVSNPPFTSQFTFPDDQVRLEHLREVAAAAAQAPGAAAQARMLIAAALRADPGNAELLLRQSEVEFESGDSEAALASVDAALALVPPSAESLVRRAHTLLALDRAAEAQAEALHALRVDPEHLTAYSELVAAARKTGDYAGPQAILDQAVLRNPSSEYLRLTRADLLFFRGRRDEAVAACRAVLASNPASAEALQRLVSLFRAEGRAAEADRLMTAALDTQPLNFSNEMALAKIDEARHDDDGVVRCLELATRAGPAGPKVHLYLASRLRREHRDDEARLEFARAWRTAVLSGQPDLAARIADLPGAGRP